MDEDGFLYIKGRIKRMIIRFDGFKVFPSFIESVIAKHPAVQSCAVVGVDDKRNSQGKLPYACISLRGELHSETDHIRDEIRALCENELPEYVLPVGYEFFDELPRTSIGKVDFRSLETSCNAAAASVAKAG